MKPSGGRVAELDQHSFSGDGVHSQWIHVAFSVVLTAAIAFAGCGLVGNTANSTTTITGAQPQITISPTSANFGNVVVGTTNTQTISVTNSGTADLTISQANISGVGFSMSGITVPSTLSPGQRTTFNIAFSPTSTANFTGNLSLASNAPNSSMTIALSGAGVTATFQLAASPTSLNFGNVAVGSNSTQVVSLSNTGNSNVTISQVSVSGSGFSTSGLTPPLTLTPSQTASVNVIFAPVASGIVTGSLTVASNATNSPTVALSGSGFVPVTHSVTLSWTPSTSVVVGYNVYRGTQSGGPYTKLNSSPVPGATYTDSTVQSGSTYFYVATAVDSNNVESVHSNEASAVIPIP